MARYTLPSLESTARERLLDTITRTRLNKYLRATRDDPHRTLRLYVFNMKTAAALLADLHFVEIALRNKLAKELTTAFGERWPWAPPFLACIDPRQTDILKKAIRNASRRWQESSPLPSGKVVAELTFGFWLSLTDRKFKHSLWTPYLHKAFLPRKPPRRASFNALLEQLRQLRNRIPHHEPIFHLDLHDCHQRIAEATAMLCPYAALIMRGTSTVPRHIMALTRYRDTGRNR